jgi:hypothetical protein
MRIVLMGVPDSGKEELGYELMKLYPRFQPRLLGSATNLLTRTYSNLDKIPALAELADYRVELFLSLSRALEMREFEDAIFVGSVLDNCAYHYVNYEDFVRSGIEDEALDTRYYLTAATLYATMIDSLSADLLVHLPMAEDTPTTEYESRVDQFFGTIIEEFGMLVVTAVGSADEKLKLVTDEIKRLEKEAHARRDNQEPSEEESE